MPSITSAISLSAVTMLTIVTLAFSSTSNAHQDDSPLARALKGNKEKVVSISGEEANNRFLVVKPVELKDNSGLVYLGGRIAKAQIQQYLNELSQLLGEEDFNTYRQNQAIRDHHTFHVTLINPFEYQHIDQAKLDLMQPIKIELVGLGRAQNEKNTAYFVVVDSPDGQYFRQNHQLSRKDFHITLGFNKTDVYDRSKGRTSVIK